MKVLAFVGSVREPARMVDAIDGLRAGAVPIDRILLSTWFGEVGQFEGLRGALIDRGVDLIEATEPIAFRSGPASYVHRGHVFHQKFALANALRRLAPDDHVVKSRPDLKFHDSDGLRRLLLGSPRPIAPALEPFVNFQHRVAVSRFNLTSPFWLDDTHFSGVVSSLSRMTSLDASYDIAFNPHVAIPEIRFFHALFAGRFAVFDRLLALPYNFGLFYPDGEREAFLRRAFADPFYTKATYGYLRLAAAAFDLEGVYGVPEVSADALVDRHAGELRHLTDDHLLRKVHAEWRDRPDAEVFAALRDGHLVTDEEWEACRASLVAIGAIDLPRIAFTPGLAVPEPTWPSLSNAREQAGAVAADPTQVVAQLDAALRRARLGTFVPPRLRAGSTYRCAGVVRLAAGEVIWETLLSAHPIEVAYAWSRDNVGDPILQGGIGLAESIVADWVFFMPIVVPKTAGAWRLLICLSIPTLNARWLETMHEVDIATATGA